MEVADGAPRGLSQAVLAISADVQLLPVDLKTKESSCSEYQIDGQMCKGSG